MLTFNFEIRFGSDGSVVNQGTTIDLTTDIYGMLSVEGEGFPALDVHFDSVRATSDNGDDIALITDG